MQKPARNYAFIGAQNLHLGMQRLGWRLGYARFRRYLREKHAVEVAFIFFGFLPEQQGLYQSLQRDGYVLVFKEVVRFPGRTVKGNVDVDLTLQAMIEIDHYEQAVIVTSDGDFASLVRHLNEKGKLAAVVSPEREKCSTSSKAL
jgi:uncharacterized LabA/DUF88 family protein